MLGKSSRAFATRFSCFRHNMPIVLIRDLSSNSNSNDSNNSNISSSSRSNSNSLNSYSSSNSSSSSSSSSSGSCSRINSNGSNSISSISTLSLNMMRQPSSNSLKNLRRFSAKVGHLKRDKDPPAKTGKEVSDSNISIDNIDSNNIDRGIDTATDTNKSSRVTDAQRAEYEHNAVKITKIGAVANLSLAMSKGGLGYIIGSTALIADAANSAGDLLSDAVVYYTIKEARKSATPDRPWGRGKLEPLGALLIAGLLLGTGTGVGLAAFQAAQEMIVTLGISPDLLASENPIIQKLISLLPEMEKNSTLNKTHDHENGLYQTAALGVSAISVIVKQILYKMTLSAGEKANSAAVMANAAQHKADVAISAAVFAGLGGSVMGFPILDPLAGLLVSALVVKQAIVTGLDALIDLSDTPANAEETGELKKSILKVSGIVSVEKLLARKSGPYLYVETTIGVNGTISASAAHRLAMLAKQSLLQRHKGRVANAVVHVYPLGSGGLGENSIRHENDRDHEHIAKVVTKAVMSLPDITSVSEVQVYYKDDGKIVVKIDVCMKPDLSIKSAHGLAIKAREMVEKVFPNISAVDVDLELEEAEAVPPTPSTAATPQ